MTEGVMAATALTEEEQELVDQCQRQQQSLIDSALDDVPMRHPEYPMLRRRALERVMSSPAYLELGQQMTKVFMMKATPVVVINLENKNEQETCKRDHEEDGDGVSGLQAATRLLHGAVDTGQAHVCDDVPCEDGTSR